MNTVDRQRDDTTEQARGVPATVESRTARLVALDHLAADLRVACHDAPAVTWTRITQCTLDAARHARPAASTEGDILTYRMALNHDLDRAFLARNQHHPWMQYDSPTVLLAIGDLLAAEHSRLTPDAST